MDTIIVSHSAPTQETGLNIVQEITEHLRNNDKWSAFYLIFTNNLKVSIINIFGGVFFGIGTFVNLFFNGFYTADVFSTIHANGTSWNVIIEHTLPHSFEMIGIWLSGGLGFFIAKTILDMMVKNRYPTTMFYKIIVVGSLISGLIILIAAYIEAFISVT
ncbi:MAG: stage II sporulation protein M [Flavobacteriaceae bacterium]|nr:stage II sporulation protein M [Flavobacteriaceae bacterium]